MTDEVELDTIHRTVQLDDDTSAHIHPGGVTVQSDSTGETVILTYEDIDQINKTIDENNTS